MKRFKVSVTQKHIKAGKRGEPKSCPLALALQEQLPSFMEIEEVKVFNDHAEFGGYHITLPTRAERFVDRFDAFEAVKPFEFFLG